ncbi:MAG: 23S rRNA (guanosine(2251)-2'-O)-methyltransferase RlmB, partial [Halieaceae bacterium]|nr:23S rRNA (guanosine(2251)-2'-O)-methyltransferase RlmB [Halieaceae bacterium]
MEYIYGIHAVDSLLRQNPAAVRMLWVQQGREDKRMARLLELARNQG